MTKCKNCGKEKERLLTFPRVFKYHRGDGTTTLEIVYRDRTETYEFQRSWTKKEIEESNDMEEDWNPFEEIDCLQSNGYREVRENSIKLNHIFTNPELEEVN